jgi:OmpA-OmpF porin, OOP family
MMAISQAENVLLLSLKRKDGVGKHDLYVSKNLGGGNWSRPALIEALSTPGDDISPFIAYDDRTLYYSTDGLDGYGDHDIFVTRRLDDTWENWTEPKNLGSGINTPSFDAYLMVSASGDTAYFSSVHETSTRGFGKSDIWKIAVPRNARAGFTLPTGVIATAAQSSFGGEKAYKGALFRLDSVYFDVDQSTPRSESREALDRLVNFMKQFPQVKIEVQGHTDSDAEADYNLELSISRAFAVRQYLIAGGIDGNRIAARGFGEERPIAPNTTPAGKQLNRRVMVEIIGVD